MATPFRTCRRLAPAIALAAVATDATAQPLDERITPLSALIGSWDTEDAYESTTGPGVERGVRTCAPALKGRYIECVTTAPRRAGGDREYRFYFSWDDRRNALVLLQFWSDVSGFSVTTVTPSAEGRSFDLRTTPQVAANGQERRSWGTLTVESADRLVWTGRANVSSDPPDVWRPVFREIWSRRPSATTPSAPFAVAGSLLTPRVFAPNVVLTTNGIAFTPDGHTVFVSRFVEDRDGRGRSRSRLFQHRFVDGSWSPAEPLRFSDRYTDYQPVLSPDGGWLYFTSTRPLPGTSVEVRQNIWVVARLADGTWGTPQVIEELMTPGVDGYAVPVRGGRLYFASDRSGGSGDVDIWSATKGSDGRYGAPQPVPAVNSAGVDNDLWVDPDERFMIFYRAEPPSSEAPTGTRDTIDLWIAFRVDGTWRAPRRLEGINSPEWELSPTVSPDGAYLFFGRRSVIHQIELAPLLTEEERRWLRR